jgi:hypothetical protein
VLYCGMCQRVIVHLFYYTTTFFSLLLRAFLSVPFTSNSECSRFLV